METDDFFKITLMRESHLAEVFEIAQANNLSYWSPEDYKAETARDDSCCLVAENNHKKVIGFLVARLIMQESCGELYNIAVIDQYKRKGIGESLLSYLTNQCVMNNLGQINLEVRESNQNAIDFYLKLDFKTVGIRKSFYTQPTENAVTMIKNLNN